MRRRKLVASSAAAIAAPGMLHAQAPSSRLPRISYLSAFEPRDRDVDSLRGTKPIDLPAEFPAVIELVINQRTARRLDLTIPHILASRADEVIE